MRTAPSTGVRYLRDNPELTDLLHAAECPDEHFGYWWKWFPERVRRRAPEWILDGDMVITGKPDWFERWASGRDRLRMAATSEIPGVDHIYGRYSQYVDPDLKLYSGLVSLPPNLSYMASVKRVLRAQPLAVPHHGQRDMSEQGVMVAAFQEHDPLPIPLDQFPFARAFQPALDYGDRTSTHAPWGYHFGSAFIMENPHLAALQASGVIDRPQDRDVFSKAAWLSGGRGQWGFSGWGMGEGVARVFVQHLGDISGKQILELGTSRGFLTLILCELGARVTTVDKHDRGAKANLLGLAAEVVVMSAQTYLRDTDAVFDAICIDLHGNSWRTWRTLWPQVASRVPVGGKVIVDNASLHTIREWAHEDGVYRLFEHLRHDPSWTCTLIEQPLPGVLVLERVA